MPKRIDFEGVIHEFPDDFTDADIAAALGAGPAQTTDAPASASGIAGVIAPAVAAATKAIPPIADAVAASPLAVRAMSTGAGAVVPAVLAGAAHKLGVPPAVTGPALAVAELQAGKIGQTIQPVIARTLNALGSTPGRNAATGAFQRVPMLSRLLRAARPLATPLAALGAGAAVNQRLADDPQIQRLILLHQLGIGSRTSDIPLP